MEFDIIEEIESTIKAKEIMYVEKYDCTDDTLVPIVTMVTRIMPWRWQLVDNMLVFFNDRYDPNGVAFGDIEFIVAPDITVIIYMDMNDEFNITTTRDEETIQQARSALDELIDSIEKGKANDVA